MCEWASTSVFVVWLYVISVAAGDSQRGTDKRSIIELMSPYANNVIRASQVTGSEFEVINNVLGKFNSGQFEMIFNIWKYVLPLDLIFLILKVD